MFCGLAICFVSALVWDRQSDWSRWPQQHNSGRVWGLSQQYLCNYNLPEYFYLERSFKWAATCQAKVRTWKVHRRVWGGQQAVKPWNWPAIIRQLWLWSVVTSCTWGERGGQSHVIRVSTQPVYTVPGPGATGGLSLNTSLMPAGPRTPRASPAKSLSRVLKNSPPPSPRPWEPEPDCRRSGAGVWDSDPEAGRTFSTAGTGPDLDQGRGLDNYYEESASQRGIVSIRVDHTWKNKYCQGFQSKLAPDAGGQRWKSSNNPASDSAPAGGHQRPAVRQLRPARPDNRPAAAAWQAAVSGGPVTSTSHSLGWAVQGRLIISCVWQWQI